MKILKILIIILYVQSTYVKPHDCTLTFIIPCYNRATIVGESIDSIYRQQLSFNFEVICTDDGSTDNTFEVLQSYCQKYSNFKVYRHKENKGASEARNTCVKHASGSLIFNLDSDNILVEGSIQKLVDFMLEKGVEAAAFSEVKHFVNSPTRTGYVYSEHYLHTNNIFDLSHQFKSSKSPGASGNYLYTKDSYYRAGGYSGEGQETWVFCFKQLATGTQFAILPHSFYWHRVSPDSYWWVLERKGLNNRNCLATLKKFTRLFTPSTVQLLRKYNLRSRLFFGDLNAGNFEIKPLSVLEAEAIFDYYTRKICLPKQSKNSDA